MPSYPQLVHLSVPELIGAAGGDPWQIDDTIQAGAPGEISELATSFHNAAVCTTQTGEEFAQAKKRFAQAWDRDDPAHPINDAEEVRRATESLHMSSEQMGRVAVDLQDIAADLAQAQRSGQISIGNLQVRLKQIDDLIESELQAAAAAGHQLDWSELKRAAVEATRQSLGEMTALRNAYGAKLNAAQMEMATDGYDTSTVAGAVPNASAPQPDRRPGQPRNLDDALDQIAGAPVPAAPKSVPMDPKAVEDFKAMARPELLRQGVPPEQVEAQLNAVVAKAQQGVGRPFYRAPEPPKQPPPGFAEGFADRWFSTEQAIKNLLGQGGPGAPGVLESWGGLLQNTAETVTNPVGTAVGEIQNAVNSPSPAYYLGEKFTWGRNRSTQVPPPSPCPGAGKVRRSVAVFLSKRSPRVVHQKLLCGAGTQRAAWHGTSSGRGSVPPSREFGLTTTGFPRDMSRNQPSCPPGPSSTGSAMKAAATSHRTVRHSLIAR